MLEFWRKRNKTKSEVAIRISSTTTGYHYKDGVNGNEVWHYKIKGFGHRIPGEKQMGTTLADLVWKFFSKI